VAFSPSSSRLDGYFTYQQQLPDSIDIMDLLRDIAHATRTYIPHLPDTTEPTKPYVPAVMDHQLLFFGERLVFYAVICYISTVAFSTSKQAMALMVNDHLRPLAQEAFTNVQKQYIDEMLKQAMTSRSFHTFSALSRDLSTRSSPSSRGSVVSSVPPSFAIRLAGAGFCTSGRPCGTPSLPHVY